MATVGKNSLGPIFFIRRLPASSAAIYGLECYWDFCIYDIGEDIHEKDGDTDLVLFISQMEIILEACNASISYTDFSPLFA